MSPDFMIYQPQLTWLMSIAHRVSGAYLGGIFYGFGVYYALARPKGITSRLEEYTRNSPDILISGAKLSLALPFFFHFYNGIRHLVWDVRYALDLPSVYIGGWIVNGLTALSSLVATFK